MPLNIDHYRLSLRSSSTVGGRLLLRLPRRRVNDGEIITIMAPSGFGKTSFLLDLAGLIDGDVFMTEGSMLLHGIDITALPAWQRRVAYGAQKPVLFPFLNLRDNLLLAIRQGDKKSKGALVKRALLDARLAIDDDDVGQRDPSTLSGGEAARASLMMLLLSEPRLLLLDEPFAALNKPLRDKMKSFIGKMVRARGLPTIMVTHQQDDALGRIITLS
ncbi:MAG: ATP-binding cassette domain-containing protein [Alphaproteobacteria bacterium]|nr:ATP-binding cassette domain-containing protein [Alphaproteobacteria bacterium]